MHCREDRERREDCGTSSISKVSCGGAQVVCDWSAKLQLVPCKTVLTKDSISTH